MDLEKIFNKYNLKVSKENDHIIQNINGHIHTPYSFSAFENINQAVKLAVKENVKILGINDFFVADGFKEFKKICEAHNIYPLFNIEFIGLIQDFQDKGIRVNDPGNPGRVYFSGKGLHHTFNLAQHLTQKLDDIKKESLKQIEEMVKKADHLFKKNGVDIRLNFNEIKKKYAVNLVRERHIAKAIRIAIHEKVSTDEEKKDILKKIYGGKDSKINIKNNNALENEIRSMLLKAGGAAFVPEEPTAFLPLEEIIEIIINAGGIPCYPVLLDALNGKYTDFESDWENMHQTLTSLNVKCIELIPGRNSLGELEKFSRFFYKKGYIILYGTEHNTPELIPLTVSCSGNIPLSDELIKISYESTCVVAAHQFLLSNGDQGYIDQEGKARYLEREKFIALGKEVLRQYFRLN